MKPVTKIINIIRTSWGEIFLVLVILALMMLLINFLIL